MGKIGLIRKKSQYAILVFFSLSVIYAFYLIKIERFSKGNIKCYFYETGTNSLLELNETEPRLGSGIFFHETSCPSDFTDVKLSFRQACSVESALLAHPKNDVFLLISSPVKVPLSQTQNDLVKELLKYPNFKIRHINFERYLHNTPLHNLYQSGALLTSLWPVSHASDVLRYATLYKFGGLYLDLDVIVLKSLSNMSNYAGAESEGYIGSGIINFSYDTVGREMAVECAKEVSRTFDGNIWGHNGPGVITRILKKRCNASSTSEMTEQKCKGFHVHPQSSFTPVSFEMPEIIFENGKSRLIKLLISQSYTIHVWNQFSAEFDLDGTDIPYLKLAEIYCPKIFTVNNRIF